MPLPDFVKIAAPLVVDQPCPDQVKLPPSPTLMMLPPDLAVIVPACDTVTVTLFDTVILPTVALANVTVELLPKMVSLDVVQAVVKGPVGLALQFAAVHVALVPFVFQYRCAWALPAKLIKVAKARIIAAKTPKRVKG